MATIDSTRLRNMFVGIADAVEARKGWLCELDGVIGDADHGIAMALGFNATRDAVSALDLSSADLTLVLNTAAKSFLNAVGASPGPLYATALMRAAAVKGKSAMDDNDAIAMLEAMAKGIQDRGKTEIGEKTMIDTWLPATRVAAEARAAGKSLGESLDAAVEAARRGAEATKDMIASKGRSSRLSERSLGHMDPGAASAVIVIEAIRDTLR